MHLFIMHSSPSILSRFFLLFSLISFALASIPQPRCVMYLTGQHPIVPELSRVTSVTHVILAFMQSTTFNTVNATSFPIFTTVSETRAKFAPGTKIMVAIGGWSDTGFSHAAKTQEATSIFAENVARMVQDTGADGVDIDWEYPGGNGEDYLTNPNIHKTWEIPAYAPFLTSIRRAIGPHKTISAAVPGLPRDMLAFTPNTLPSIMQSVDFLNVMTYDLMNRRDNVTKHHTGIANSLEAVDAYMSGGVPAEKINLGFAFYIKWFKTAENEGCKTNPVGCKTELMEDPKTGADLGKAGAFSWHDVVPSELKASFQRAMEKGSYDEHDGGHYFWDQGKELWWSWDTAKAIKKKFPKVVEERGLGGVFAWGLGEDGEKWGHFDALIEGVEEWKERLGGRVEEERDEL